MLLSHHSILVTLQKINDMKKTLLPKSFVRPLLRPIATLLFFLLILTAGWAQPNWSVNIGSDRSTWLNVGLLGRSDQVGGVSLNAISGVVRDDMRGVQVAGLLTATMESVWGVQTSALLNYGGRSVRGVQLSGLMNLTRHSLYGVALSGIGNFSGRDMRGVQLSGLMNVAVREANGVQLSGLANVSRKQNGVQLTGFTNIAGEMGGGLQLAGATNIVYRSRRTVQLALTNFAMEQMGGLQLGVANYAGEVNGVQLGLVNLAIEGVRGVQLGLVNVSRDTTALKLGLVNVCPGHTRVQLLLFGGNTTKTNVAARFTNGSVYTIVGGGTHYLGLNKDFSGSFFYRLGYQLPLKGRWSVHGDAGFVHIESFHDDSAESPSRFYALQLRAGLECRLNRHLSVFGDGGYSWTREYHHARMFRHKPVVELGVAIL